MKIENKIEYWLDIAEYDMETARHMQARGRYLYTVFLCQQALEKILKSLHIKKFGKESSYSHNLVYLQSNLELDLSESQRKLLAVLTAFYIEGRYPSYKKKLSSLVDKAQSATLLNKTEKLYQCLKSKLIS
ncbi:MAG: HEPN domain-containing protein [Candidatus Schekmanbacteria bacterium]|nr:HEPN domain-containing protein [Candidatus Schekmanbacteria bacterium]